MILRDEPQIEYWYTCIKYDKERGATIGNIVHTSTRELDNDTEHYRFLGSYRRAFVGDMQEKLNEVFKTDLMRRFAEQHSVNPSTFVIREVIVRQSFPQYMKEKRQDFFSSIQKFFNFRKRMQDNKIKKEHKKRVKEDKEFFDTFFNE